ncbi:MAG TPA: hypothetical protein DCE56_17040 [Cyanobacteria bacterium UBA8553]|nr:hypothetical protein [Cyanobacteria bacterium UBA8553]HAJ64572.1 hypothetical protein [Cyanobacteria bacterium UBA8543]
MKALKSLITKNSTRRTASAFWMSLMSPTFSERLQQLKTSLPDGSDPFLHLPPIEIVYALLNGEVTEEEIPECLWNDLGVAHAELKSASRMEGEGIFQSN